MEAKFECQINTTEEGTLIVDVWVMAPTVDRPNTYGISVPNLTMAARVKEAVESGAMLVPKEVMKDVNGKTFLSFECKVLGRNLNSALTSLGF